METSILVQMSWSPLGDPRELGPIPEVSDSAALGWGWRVCTSSRFLGAVGGVLHTEDPCTQQMGAVVNVWHHPSHLVTRCGLPVPRDQGPSSPSPSPLSPLTFCSVLPYHRAAWHMLLIFTYISELLLSLFEGHSLQVVPFSPVPKASQTSRSIYFSCNPLVFVTVTWRIGVST